ncbi:MAG: hypothetical protein Tsb009_15050 [Planctomycetaceae bacterium]
MAYADSGKPTKSNTNSAKKTEKLVPLNKQGTVLLDLPGKRLLLKSKVVLREGLLEMLCCLKQTKEHESILSVDAKAYVVHTGLLALGAKPGTPVKFRPKFQAPKGQEIQIFLQWKDKQGKLHRQKAQTWVRHAIRRFYTAPMKSLPKDLTLPPREKTELRFDKDVGELIWYGHMTAKQRDELLKRSRDKDYRKAIQSFYRQSQSREMKAKWVFAGSSFAVTEQGERYYRAEVGNLICVANFPSATIDVAVKSSADKGSTAYEAYTERIPPKGTEVTIELIPVFPKKTKSK